MKEYLENEKKVLEVDVSDLKTQLERLGATKVWEGNRTIYVIDTPDCKHLLEDKLIRVTEEEKTKVSIHINNSLPSSKKKVIKYKVSRIKEQLDFFEAIGMVPITKVIAKRTSYELNGIDFDIDEFPYIPAFLEIDLENSKVLLTDLLEQLHLAEKKVVDLGTEDIFRLYGLDYFEVFKVSTTREKHIQ